MNKKIIVTGSSGFIGKHLVNALIEQNYEVKGIDINEFSFSHEKFSFQKCDILDGEKLVEIINDFSPHAVIHLAARIDLTGANLQAYAANIDGVRNLINAIQNTKSINRCIFTSSQLVCRAGYVPKHAKDYKPTTFYGESKVLTERNIWENDGGGIEWCIVRPTTIWGPGMSKHYQTFFRSIKNGTYFHVGHKPLYKSYGYVKNTAYQFAKLLNAPVEQIHRQVFYMADYEPLSLRDWANVLSVALGVKPIKTLPASVAKTAAKIGDVVNKLGIKSFPLNSFRLNNILTEYQFDLSNTEEVCGQLPYNIETGVKDTVLWLEKEIFSQ